MAVLATPASAAGNPLTIKDVAFSAAEVDSTPGYGTVSLEWTVTDTDATATRVTGTVELRQYDGATYVGLSRTLTYASDYATSVSVYPQPGSTAQESHYRYDFIVPQYGASATATWRVYRISTQDDRGHAKTLSSRALEELGAAFTVHQLDDETPPTVGAVWLYNDQPMKVYDSGAGTTISYYVDIEDEGVGFRKGTLVLAGPGDARISTDFGLEFIAGQNEPVCGGLTVYDPTFTLCVVNVVIPPDSPSGNWSVQRVRVLDAVDNVAVARDLPAPVVGVSRNDVLSASDFAVSPAVVDNWRAPAISNLVFRPAGAVGGVTAVDVATGGSCWPASSIPTANPDGTMSIPIQILDGEYADRCDISGIALTDGAGHEAYYGPTHRGSDLGLVITRVPDDTPPLVLSATLRQSVWTQSELAEAWGIGLDVVVDNSSGAPVTQWSTTVFNAQPASVGGGSGGISEEPDGHLSLAMFVGVLPPGEYTVGFTVTDAGGRFTQLGYPNRPPGPNGPLVITVVAG